MIDIIQPYQLSFAQADNKEIFDEVKERGLNKVIAHYLKTYDCKPFQVHFVVIDPRNEPIITYKMDENEKRYYEEMAKRNMYNNEVSFWVVIKGIE